MPLTSKTVFVCDRDGTQSPEIDGPPANTSIVPAPADWLQFNWLTTPTGDATKNGAGYLCPACAAAFREFMGVLSP